MKKNYAFYQLDYDDTIDIYPFKSVVGSNVLRPCDEPWKQQINPGHQFVYITSRKKIPKHSLVFIKFWDREKRMLTFRGAIPVSQDQIVADRFNHILQICGATDICLKLRLINIFSKTQYRGVDLTRSFEDQGLQTGAILILQAHKEPISTEPQTGLVNPPYAQHQYKLFDINSHSFGMKLYQQARSNQYTDVVISSRDMDGSLVKLSAHKNVLATIPYFKTCFESGMKENANPSSLVKLRTPDWITETNFQDFLFCVYIGDCRVFNQFSLKTLCNLIKIADFYSSEELLENIGIHIEGRYADLNEDTILLLIETIDVLEFPQKKSIEDLAVNYVVSNFFEVARTPEFHCLLGKDIYNRIVDVMSRATWPKG